MTGEVALRRIIKKIPEAAQWLVVVMHVADQHGTQIIDNNKVLGISDLGRELAVLLLREKKWQDVAEQARKDILRHEIVH